MRSSVNKKYKTTMCKHFEQTGHCYLGPKCHFAHGPEELRNTNDPLPQPKLQSGTEQKGPQPNFQYQLPPSVTNYKTIKCRYFEKGHCKFGSGCSFAHGEEDVRSPNSPIPQNAVSNLQNNNMMNSFFDAGVQNHIAQEQITYLITQVEGHHSHDELTSKNLNKAKEINQGGNVQAAASIVYGIINRQYKNSGDEEAYNQFIQNMQSYGNYLYQQIQLQYQQGLSSMYGFSPVNLGSPSQMMGMTPPLGNPFGFGTGYAPSNYYGENKGPKGHYEPNGKGKSAHEEDQEQDHGEPSNLGEITNKMDAMHISPQNQQQNQYSKPYGGKPKYNNSQNQPIEKSNQI